MHARTSARARTHTHTHKLRGGRQPDRQDKNTKRTLFLLQNARNEVCFRFVFFKQTDRHLGRQADIHADITCINDALRQDSPELGHDVLMLVADHLGVQLAEVRHLANRTIRTSLDPPVSLLKGSMSTDPRVDGYKGLSIHDWTASAIIEYNFSFIVFSLFWIHRHLDLSTCTR